jgi:16S rRNA (adenine1518-N6/adenine1519-N6)-dimethyltransferase
MAFRFPNASQNSMEAVKAKKHLGQHFLKDQEICNQIADELQPNGRYSKILEIGPGMGALTKSLLEQNKAEIYVIDIDKESIVYLHDNFKILSNQNRIIDGDFLKMDLTQLFGEEPFAVAGNFPYNISSQILFKVLDYRHQIPEVVGMFQKEVAERIAHPPGSKAYGILSVLLQAFYNISYCFTVDEHKFIPPPKVKSGVIRLVRNEVQTLDCDEKLFKLVVKTAFNQRRKTLRNSLKSLIPSANSLDAIFDKRPEQLAVSEFIYITKIIENLRSSHASIPEIE